MTISITDLVAIIGVTAAAVAVPALVGGLFLGARLAQPRPRNRTTDQRGSAALVELLQLLRESLTIVRDLRGNQTRELPTSQPRRKNPRRK